MTVEYRIKQMSPQERQVAAHQLLQEARQYLPAYRAAVARGEIVVPGADRADEPAAGQTIEGEAVKVSNAKTKSGN